MIKIKKLPYSEIQKIAAGEVIERPANVVKELVENSLDAGATKIDIYVQGGGHEFIRVVDNGSGIAAEDINLAFEQHATSKLTSVDELAALLTLGFRGEALSSIAGVSKVTLITKDAESADGIRHIRRAHEILTEEIIACLQGTDITIEDIFFNVPVRRKFLKKSDTEWRHIVHLFNAYCFAYCHIHFRIFSENKLVYNRPPSIDAIQRAHVVWDTQTNLLSLDYQDAGIRVTGVISDPHHGRYDRSNFYFFVNRRLVKNYTLVQAVLKGYASLMLPKQYPSVCIAIELDVAEVDVNIHPRKEEVQFLHPRRLENIIGTSIKERLETYTSEKLVGKPVRAATYTPFAGSIAYPASYREPYLPPEIASNMFVPKHTIVPMPEQSGVPRSGIEHGRQEVYNVSENVEQTFISTDAPEWKLLGQYHATYLLLEQNENLVLLDQHAAHERILYERFKEKFGSVPTVSLIFPHIVTLSYDDAQIVEPFLHGLEAHGVVCRIFGTHQIRIEATPVGIKNVAWELLFKELIAWIIERENLDISDVSKALHEHVHTHMACKAAVKAGDVLNMEQMQQLLTDLVVVENRFSCPHGRPTLWEISLHEIEKKFKRKL